MKSTNCTKHLVFAASAAFCLCLPTGKAVADEDLFIPSLPVYYNPLGETKDRRQQSEPVTLSNEALLRNADEIRNNRMPMTQRALNHQWLDQDRYEEETRLGGKVFSSIVKMGLKTYWDDLRDDHLSESYLKSAGTSKSSKDVDYNLRLSGDKLNLSVKYDF